MMAALQNPWRAGYMREPKLNNPKYESGADVISKTHHEGRAERSAWGEYRSKLSEIPQLTPHPTRLLPVVQA
jgi:hypothetical protein